MTKLLYAFCVFAVSAQAGELTLHFVPSPKGVNWKNPYRLTISTLKNQIAGYHGGKRHEIGHVYEEITCRDQHFYADVTSASDSEERENILKQGYGLGIVLKAFKGKMDTDHEISSDLKSMQATGRSNFLKFLISDQTCDRLVEYVIEYKRRGYDKTYAGLNARPRLGQGSGCSAFAFSFLELAGLSTPEFASKWMRNYIIPRKFVGGPLTRKKVSILRLVFSAGSHWDESESLAGFRIHFYDPELMHQWAADTYQAIDSKNEATKRSLSWPVQVMSIDQSKGVLFDARDVPTPTEPIFFVNP